MLWVREGVSVPPLTLAAPSSPPPPLPPVAPAPLPALAGFTSGHAQGREVRWVLTTTSDERNRNRGRSCRGAGAAGYVWGPSR